jgi:hypothetical protein
MFNRLALNVMITFGVRLSHQNNDVTLCRVTRLVKMSPFGLLFKGPGKFLEETSFVVGILRV